MTTPLLKKHSDHLDLLIYPNGNGYGIEYERMDTPEKVLGWVYHLCQKNNVTKDHLRKFIEAAKDNGVKVGFHA